MHSRSSFQIFRAVISALVLREFIGRFSKRRMGAVWVILEPFLHVLVLTLFFTYIRGRSAPGVDYPVFLIVALVPFFLYRNIASRLMDSVDANRGLFAYKQIKPLDTFIARTIVEAALMCAVYSLLLFIFAWVGFDVTVAEPVQWLCVLAFGLAFSFGFGVVLAVIVNALPDVRFFVRMLFLPLYFISGIIFPPSRFPQEYLPLILWNPFLHFSELSRHFVFQNYQMVQGISFEYVLESTTLMLFCALALYWVRRLKLLSI